MNPLSSITTHGSTFYSTLIDRFRAFKGGSTRRTKPSPTPREEYELVVPGQNSASTGQDAEVLAGTFQYNRCPRVRIACLTGLAITWVVSFALLGIGTYLFVHPQKIIHGWPKLLEVASLITNMFLTGILESIGHLHTTVLRWALVIDGRLEFNSNLRLMTSSRISRSNSWYINTLYLMIMSIAYAASTTLFQASAMDDNGQLVTAPVAVAWLGLCLLVLASIVTWAYVGSTIPTWSSSPLDVTMACIDTGALVRDSGRCTMAVIDIKWLSVPLTPQAKQASSWSSHLGVRRVTRFLWLTTAAFSALSLSCVLTTVVVLHGSKDDPYMSWTPLPEMYFSASWTFLGRCDFSTAPSSPQAPVYRCPASNVVQILLMAAFQVLLTVCLHTAELLVNVRRDEYLWRAATSRKGCDAKGHLNFTAALKSPRCVFLFGFKAFLHWYSGKALVATFYSYPSSFDTSDFNSSNLWMKGYALAGSDLILNPGPMGYTAVMMIAFTVAFTVVANLNPRGPQPATYGHLQTLANLIDEWHPTMFWGHKTSGEVCHAGTSDHPLEPVRMDKYYAGNTSDHTRKRC